MSQFYQLMPNETLIFEENNVHKGQNTGIYSDTLILTTVNIVHISSKGLFGRKANVTVMPLKEMMKFEGKPQALMRKTKNGTSALYLRFINGNEEYFSFKTGNRRIIKKWVRVINDLEQGQFDPSVMNDTTPDADSLAGLVQQATDMVDEFKDSLGGIVGGSFKKEGKPTIITTKCSSCGAPITGEKGQVVTCEYCDTKQTL